MNLYKVRLVGSWEGKKFTQAPTLLTIEVIKETEKQYKVKRSTVDGFYNSVVNKDGMEREGICLTPEEAWDYFAHICELNIQNAEEVIEKEQKYLEFAIREIQGLDALV